MRNPAGAPEHFRRGFPGGTVQGIYGKPGFGILCIGHLIPGIYISPHPVFRAEEGHQVHLRRLEEDVDGGVQLAVHAGRVGDQADALAFQAREMVVTQDFDARLDARGGGGGRSRGGAAGYEEQRCRAKNVTVMVARQHIMTTIKNPT